MEEQIQNELLTFDKTVTVDQVKGWTGLEPQEWFKGNGVYQIEIGSRCEVESVVFYGQISGLWIDDITKHIDQSIEFINNDETMDEDERAEQIEWVEKDVGIFVDESGFVDVMLTDEHSFLYFKVV